MIKKLLFLAALLIPGVAYGGNPAADLTVQIVPSGSVGNCGTPLGAAAADVQAAGFTTCARYNDFTTPIPNTVGTGLPNDWLNCTQNDTPAAVWYWSLNWIDTYGNALPCVSGPGANSSNSAVYQTIDPVAGGTVLDLRGGSSTCNPNAFNGHCTATINTIPYGAVDTYTAPNSGVYPNSYVEIVFREDTGTGINAGATYWYGNAEAVRNGLPSGNGIEMDMQECWGCTFWDTAIHRWTSTSGDLGPNQTFGAQFSQINPSQYHTWGFLRTSKPDGSSFTVCTYIDGVKQTCGTNISYPTTAWANLRNYMNVNIKAPGPNTYVHYYLKYFKIFTCANWQDPSTNGECASP